MTGRCVADLGLTEAWEGIRSGEITSFEYVSRLLDRIGELDGEIEAWAWLDRDSVLAAARACDDRLKGGEAPGPLHGIPVGIKDIFAVKGIPTEMGSPAFAGNVFDYSAQIICRMEKTGGLVMGKTVTAECAFLHPGKTKNPWNLRHSPGGSSSGSAAAVAAGFVPAAIGTQTNGSVIRPAAFCGVVGYKPSQGTIPISGALPFSPSLDQVGFFTRSAADAAWLACALSVSDTGPAGQIRPLLRAPSLAAVRTPVWDQAEGYAQRSLHSAIKLARGAGAEVEEVELPEFFAYAHSAIRTIMLAESASEHEELRLRKAPLLSSTLTEFLAEGREVPAVAYLQALKLKERLREELALFLDPYDAIITLPASGEAPDTLAHTGNPAFCSIWSLCGVPAVVIPIGVGPRDLPLGLQVVGGFGRDEEALAIACWLESLFGFQPLTRRR